MATRSSLRAYAAAFVLSASLLGAPACASPGGRFYVRVGPPVPIVEARVVAPGPRYIWVPGYYLWTGRAYAWAPGRWVLPPRPRAVWVPGHWTHDRRGWYFVGGYWR